MKSAKIKLPKKRVSDDDIGNVAGSSNGVVAKASRKRLTDEEKAERQAAKDFDKALKKSVQEQRRAQAPGNAIKHLTVLLPEAITIRYEALSSFLTASEIKNSIGTSPILDNLVVFRRDLVHKSLGDDLEMHSIVDSAEEDNLILIMFPDEYIPKIAAHVQDNSNNIIDYVRELQDLLAGKKLTLFLMELEKYYRKQKASKQHDFRNLVLNDGMGDAQTQPKKRNKNKAELPTLTPREVSSTLVELQILTGANYRVIKDVQELGIQLTHYAKAVADAPYKRRKQQDGLDWYAFCDSGNIKVDKDGNGLKTLWIDQLMQFNNVGIDTAQAIASKYPSPVALLRAYDNINTLDEGLNLLKDIHVRMGIGVLAKTRKVGPEISKRVYRFFTCTTGERSLTRSQDS